MGYTVSMARTINLLDINLSDQDKILVRQLIDQKLIKGGKGKLRHKKIYTVNGEEIKLSHSIGKSGDHYSVYERSAQSLGGGLYGTVKPIYDIELTQSSLVIRDTTPQQHRPTRKVVKIQKKIKQDPNLLERERMVSEKYYDEKVYLSSRKGSKGPVTYLILPRVAGVPLETFCKSDDFKNFTFAQRVELAKKIVDELIKLQDKTGLIHDDLHQGNVMYDYKTGSVKLIDFGLVSNKIDPINSSKIFSTINTLVLNLIKPISSDEYKNSFNILQERLAGLKIMNSSDVDGRTPLYYAIPCPVLLSEVLTLYTQQDLLAAVQTKDMYGGLPLHRAVDYPESLKAILTLLPKQDLLKVLQLKDAYGNTLLHAAVHSPESITIILTLLPTDEARLEALQIKDINGESLLHRAISQPNSIKTIFNFLPKREDKLAAVQAKGNDDKTPLHEAAESPPESLLLLLNLLSNPEDQLTAVQIKDSNGRVPLHYASATRPDCLQIILNLYPEKDRFAAAQIQDNEGRTPMFYAAATHPKLLQAILTVLPEQDQFKAMQQIKGMNNQPLLEAVERAFCKHGFPKSPAGNGLMIYFLALDAIKPFTQGSQQSNSSFFSQNPIPKDANILRVKLSNCTSGEMVRDTVTDFLTVDKDGPTKPQIKLLEKLTHSESIQPKDYNQQLQALTDQWQSEFGSHVGLGR